MKHVGPCTEREGIGQCAMCELMRAIERVKLQRAYDAALKELSYRG